MIKTKIILLVKILLLYIVICDSYHSSYYTSFSIIKQVQNTKHSKSTRLFTAGDVARPIVAGSLEAIDANSLQANNVISRSFTFMKHIWNFTRPHTIVGSAASIICLYLFAVPMQLWTTKQFFHSIMVAMLPSLLMNLYITGLNQVTDVEIDKINKPYLPIAAGQITKSEGIAVIVTSLLASMYLIQKVAWPLQATVIGSGVLGTVYSLPPFRLKRFPLLAAFCILVVRGTLINMGFYLQAKIDVIGASVTSARSIIQSFPESVAATVFFAVFGLVIALMKDVPDIKGDTVYKIKSFSVRLGALRIFR